MNKEFVRLPNTPATNASWHNYSNFFTHDLSSRSDDNCFPKNSAHHIEKEREDSEKKKEG